MSKPGSNNPLSWQRLTKREATNYVITALIAKGFDPNGELVVDGEPGPFLEKTARELDYAHLFDEHWPQDRTEYERQYPAKPGMPDIPGWQIFGVMAIVAIAKDVGFKGERLSELITYLRDLPDEGPIG